MEIFKKVKEKTKDAFTLVELLVTMSVMAILAAILVPMVVRTRTTAKRAITGNDIHQVCGAMGQYHMEEGRYPIVPQDGNPYNNSAMVMGLEGFDWEGKGSGRYLEFNKERILKGNYRNPPTGEVHNLTGKLVQEVEDESGDIVTKTRDVGSYIDIWNTPFNVLRSGQQGWEGLLPYLVRSAGQDRELGTEDDMDNQ